MTLPLFSSRDFVRVPSELTPEIPEVLLHADVRNSKDAHAASFSEARRHLVRTVDLPSRVMSMTLGGLQPGEATRRHRHNYETLIYVLEGSGESIIEDRTVKWNAGDAFYVPVWAWHSHINRSNVHPATYIACENAPMLQNLGIALREEQ
jgi:gentisate 1,2-dioxygenase